MTVDTDKQVFTVSIKHERDYNFPWHVKVSRGGRDKSWLEADKTEVCLTKWGAKRYAKRWVKKLSRNDYSSPNSDNEIYTIEV